MCYWSPIILPLFPKMLLEIIQKTKWIIKVPKKIPVCVCIYLFCAGINWKPHPASFPFRSRIWSIKEMHSSNICSEKNFACFNNHTHTHICLYGHKHDQDKSHLNPLQLLCNWGRSMNPGPTSFATVGWFQLSNIMENHPLPFFPLLLL